MLAFAHDGVVRDRDEQRRLTARAFAGDGWHVPQMLEAMGDAQDLYFDSIQQVRMPSWHQGRVVLVGDAAYGPSFLTGQGTSLAMAGAYVLASELARHPDHAVALKAYQHRLRPYVDANQAMVHQGQMMIVPTTAQQLSDRNAALQSLTPGEQSAADGQPAHAALDLGDYVALL